MSRIKTLFPLSVPSSLPAFDKDPSGKLKYFFKPSVANTLEQIHHLHVSVVRLDTNRNILNRNDYPYEFMFISKDQISFDEKRKYYYFEIPNSIFPASDTAYKVQVRAVEPAEGMPTLNSPQMGTWIKDNLNKISEWSIVTIVMPITVPEVGIQNFSETEVNSIDSSGYNFVAYYEPKDPNKAETLTSYSFNMYYYKDLEDRSTWKLYASSGEKTIGIYEKPNLSYVFDKDLQQSADYVVVLSIKTKNLYTKSIIYRVKAAYPTLEMFNTINTKVNVDEANIEITVNAKQIIMKPLGEADIKYILDEPGYESQPNIRATHAVITGMVSENKNFFLVNLEGKWVIQSRVKIDKLYTTLKDCYASPFIEVCQNSPLDTDSFYFTKIKLCALKENINYPLYTEQGLVIPEPEWRYKIIARKEVLRKDNGVETLLFSQNKSFTSDEIADSNKEFYIHLQENQGLMNLTVQKTY